MNRYPFGLHGYHRPSGKSGKVELYDPLNVFGSTYDPAAKAAANEPPPPKIEQPTTMPTSPTPGLTDSMSQAAKRKTLEDQLARRGRMSTVLTFDPTAGRLGSSG